jgi:hypothetical protein
MVTDPIAACGRRVSQCRDREARSDSSANGNDEGGKPDDRARDRQEPLFARAPVDGAFVVDVLPSMILLGLGAGMALNPVLLAAMSDVEPGEAGLASGVVNTSFMMGGALGLAIHGAVLLRESAAPAADAHEPGEEEPEPLAKAA